MRAYSFAESHGLPLLITRGANTYGPYQYPEKVIPRFITQALSGEPLTIHGDGHASRDWLYVEDDAEAIDRVMNPARNKYRVDMLDVAYHSPMMRALNHASYVFEKKLSHTADSQDQRHRMVPASRPLMPRSMSWA